jgi:trehalose 6-phosphate phosphatase
MTDLPQPSPQWCLFLDFDGTLVELRDHPEDVEAPASLARLLLQLLETFDGAVAIVSGRSVEGLERLLAPLQLPLAGVHGLERRDANGVLHSVAAGADALAGARDEVQRFVGTRSGLHWEDKGAALAVHFRDAPERADEVRGFLEGQRETLGAGFHIQAGKAVLELKPASSDKGRVVAAFMGEPPFAGRTPVFIGDDVTDEYAFDEVNRRGGVSIRVGDPGTRTRARHRLPTVAAAVAWLESLPGALVSGTATDRAP